MKRRSCFVSNSSSSSFCILGMPIDREEFELIENSVLKEKHDYGYGIEDYYEQVVVGISPYGISDDETLGEVKTRVAEKLKKVGIKNPEIGWHTDGGFDG